MRIQFLGNNLALFVFLVALVSKGKTKMRKTKLGFSCLTTSCSEKIWRGVRALWVDGFQQPSNATGPGQAPARLFNFVGTANTPGW